MAYRLLIGLIAASIIWFGINLAGFVGTYKPGFESGMASIMVEFFGLFAVAIAGVGYLIIRARAARDSIAAKRELIAARVCLVVAALLVIGYRIARWKLRI